MAVDKNVLKQYWSHLKEIEDEENRITKLQTEIDDMRPEQREVTDIVTKGKRGKKPLGLCIIRGKEDYSKLNKKIAEIKRRKAKKELHQAELEIMVIDAETYIYSMEESELRRIILFRCIDGLKNWKDVAEAMGEGYTAELCKQKFSRFMRAK